MNILSPTRAPTWKRRALGGVPDGDNALHELGAALASAADAKRERERRERVEREKREGREREEREKRERESTSRNHGEH